MTDLLSPIALDFETSAAGRGSTDFFRKDFRVDSIALTWEQEGSLTSVFYDTPRHIDAAMQRLHDTQRPVIVHPLMFEKGVTTALWPDLNINWQYDTLRMAQLLDGEGTARDIAQSDDSFGVLIGSDGKAEIGLSLVKCVKRYLPKQYHNHKDEAYKWLEDNHGITKGHGSHLEKLPRDVMIRYNIGDTENTYRLWQVLSAEMAARGYNDRPDWSLFSAKTGWFNESKIFGFAIDRPGLLMYISDMEQAIDKMSGEFLEFCGKEDLDAYREFRILRDVEKMKAQNREKGIKMRQKQAKWSFNTNSGTQFAEFLMKYKGCKPSVFTKPAKNRSSAKPFAPSPSTATANMWQWGEGGKIMEKKGKMTLNLNQAMAIYILSDHDGVFHPDVQAATTSTNRVKGGTDDL